MAKEKESGEPVRQNPIEERLRVNLLLFLEQSGYSATQVADLSGIAAASLGRYMRGENAIQADALKSLAEVFGRSIEDFYQREPPPPPKDLQTVQPVFLRARPGVVLTDEDLQDFETLMRKISSRRQKKQK